MDDKEMSTVSNVRVNNAYSSNIAGEVHGGMGNTVNVHGQSEETTQCRIMRRTMYKIVCWTSILVIWFKLHHGDAYLYDLQPYELDFVQYTDDHKKIPGGIGLILAAALIQEQLHDVADIVGNEYNTLCIVVILAGVLMFLTAALGNGAACIEDIGCLKVFASFLVIIVLLKIAAGITGFVFLGQVQQIAVERMNRSLKDYRNNIDVKEGWKNIQQYVIHSSLARRLLENASPFSMPSSRKPMFMCCGVEGHTDWMEILPDKPPDSCCKNIDGKQCEQRSYGDLSSVYTKSCQKKIISWLKKHLIIIGSIAFCLAFLEVWGIYSVYCLSSAIKKTEG